MTTLTAKGFRQRFPEYNIIEDDTVIERAIKMAGLQFNYQKCAEVDDDLAEEMGYLLTAHWIAVNVKPGAGTNKQIASESLGSASKSYSEPSDKYKDDPFMATKYGQQFQTLYRSNCSGFGIAII